MKTLTQFLKEATSVRNKLDKSTKNKIGDEFRKNGLDGNGRFEKPGLGLAKACDILRRFDIILDDIVDGFFLNNKAGTKNYHMGFIANTGNSFDPPTRIENSLLVLSWHEQQEYRYEVLAYLS